MNGEYGTMTVRGAQGAFPNGTYPFGSYRKVVREMKHFTAVSSFRSCPESLLVTRSWQKSQDAVLSTASPSLIILPTALSFC